MPRLALTNRAIWTVLLDNYILVNLTISAPCSSLSVTVSITDPLETGYKGREMSFLPNIDISLRRLRCFQLTGLVPRPSLTK